ncbi:MAG: hypothetical protein WCS94_23450 [Verrucomicrobiota bacterium]
MPGDLNEETEKTEAEEWATGPHGVDRGADLTDHLPVVGDSRRLLSGDD